ncbi:hypothetical protein DFH27DRAFT_529427 [Peziza echinospora]|nr:hypothetical protein DFH27DRAFT_529427 [Peziza echinospora]
MPFSIAKSVMLLAVAVAHFGSLAAAARDPKSTALNQMCYVQQLNLCRFNNARVSIRDKLLEDVMKDIPANDPRLKYLNPVYLNDRPQPENYGAPENEEFWKIMNSWNRVMWDFKNELMERPDYVLPPVDYDAEPDPAMEGINFYGDNCCPTGWQCLKHHNYKMDSFCYANKSILITEEPHEDIAAAKLNLLTFEYTRQDGAVMNLLERYLKEHPEEFEPSTTVTTSRGLTTSLPKTTSVFRGNLSISYTTSATTSTMQVGLPNSTTSAGGETETANSAAGPAHGQAQTQRIVSIAKTIGGIHLWKMAKAFDLIMETIALGYAATL